MTVVQTIPLFPLNLVLFPGAHLPLQIFEPRYTDLVGECLKNDSGFGVCCIKEGSEVGEHATCHDVGTYAKIIDWSQLDNGLLGITVEAEQRFVVENYSRRANTLLQGEVSWLEDKPGDVIEERFEVLRDFMVRVLDHYEISYQDQDRKINENRWLSYRLAEYLPFALDEKQALLELDDNNLRLQRIHNVLEENDFSYEVKA